MSVQSSSISFRGTFLFWAGVFFALMGFVWLFGNALLPFILGATVAYLLDPLVEYLSKWKISRWLATILIVGLFFILIGSILAFVLPIIYRELMALADTLPTYIEILWEKVVPYNSWLQERIGNGNIADFQNVVQNNIGKAVKISTGVLGGIASGGKALMSFLSVIVLTPVVAFFMINEWPTITAWIDNLIPRKNYDTIKTLLNNINGKISGFVRGQISVAFALAMIYAIALSIVGLQFGFLIGFSAGLLSIIPMAGSAVGLVAGIIAAWLQTGSWELVIIVAIIFGAGQVIEGYILTPKLLGKNVGMHPLWILFALMAGGGLYGIVGMLLAIPVAASIGVLISFGIEEYKKSSYYANVKNAKAKASTKKTKKT